MNDKDIDLENENQNLEIDLNATELEALFELLKNKLSNEYSLIDNEIDCEKVLMIIV